jgi:hypothetical protein
MRRFALARLPLLFVYAMVPTGWAAAAPTADEMEAAIAAIPEQQHYPDGYREMRAAAGLFEREAAPRPQAPTPPHGGTSTDARERVRVAAPQGGGTATRNEQGGQIVQILQSLLLPRTAATATAESGTSEPAPQLYLSACHWSPDLDSADPREAAIELTARRVAMVEQRLQAGGYPPYLFADLLLEYERQLLAHAGQTPAGGADEARAHMQGGMAEPDTRLIGELETRRSQNRGDLPRVSRRDSCYYAAVPGIAPAYVMTNPVGGRVWVISEFFFAVCRRDWNVDRCRRWREVHADQAEALAGIYQIQAQWSDGATWTGERTFERAGREPRRVPIQHP